jgi:hypothetical protein
VAAPRRHTLTVSPGDVTPIVEAPSVPWRASRDPAADPKYKTVASDVDRSQGVPVTTQFPAWCSRRCSARR